MRVPCVAHACAMLRIALRCDRMRSLRCSDRCFASFALRLHCNRCFASHSMLCIDIDALHRLQCKHRCFIDVCIEFWEFDVGQNIGFANVLPMLASRARKVNRINKALHSAGESNASNISYNDMFCATGLYIPTVKPLVKRSRTKPRRGFVREHCSM